MNTRSIRFRLIAWYASLLTGVFLLLAGLMFWGLQHYLVTNLRQTQARRARQIADTLLAKVKQTGDAYVVAEIKSLYAPEINDRFIRITRPDGSQLYVSGAPQDQSFDPAGLPVFSPAPPRDTFKKEMLPDGKILLIALVNYQTPGGVPYLVEVGASTVAIDAMLSQLLLLLAIGLPIVVLAGIGGGYVLVGRALAPVDQIASKAEQITQHNLSDRLPVPQTADELRRLTMSLNLMIARLEDALLNSKRFVADASHELRTPLTVLRAELESIVSNEKLTPESRDTIGSLLEEVDRLARIVEGLLALSRLDAGEAQSAWEKFDLADLAATTADQISLLAEDKGVTIACEAKQPVVVEGDRARLKQVVVNLLDNAIKYTPEKGRIQVRVTADHQQGVLEVSDTGIGIPAEVLPHVFDRFYRVDQSRARDPGGAGLGLSIVKSICTAHGATVEAGKNPGGGSQFRIKLPLSAPQNHPDIAAA